MVVDNLAQKLLLASEVRSSNPVIGKILYICFLLTLSKKPNIFNAQVLHKEAMCLTMELR